MDKRKKLVRPQANGSWDKYYKQLSAFYKHNGHFEVPYASKKYRKLAQWLASQKFKRNAGLLGAMKIQLLEELGFEWIKKDSNQGKRERRHKILNDFYNKNRHCNVPYKLAPLGAWISRQRRLYREGKLSQKDINFLENMHITWDLKRDDESIWDEKYKKLLAVKQQYGHFDIPHKNNTIMHWKGYLRNAYRNGTLSTKRIRLLEKIGFTWGPKDARWQNKYEAAEI